VHLFVALTMTAALAAAPVDDPIPAEPVTMGLGVVLSEYAAFPQSQPDPAPTDQRLQRKARINTILEVPDGSGRRAVPDLNGKLYLVRNGVPSVYLDVAAQFQPQFFSGRGLGQGFGYVTFHPDFRANGLFYTVHSEESAQTTARPDWQQSGTFLHNVVTEWRATDPAANTFAGTRRELLRLGFGGQIHGIQEINFNPTARPGTADHGLLYLAVGDGGLGVRNTEPQNLSLPYGKLLRIDPRGTNAANRRYGIPAGNPFVSRAGALGEVYAYGFRDPHRFSWDTATGRLYLGHIGEKTIEAVYEVRAGDNLGWSDREGNWVFDRAATNPCDRLYPLPAGDAQLGYTYPVAMYDHNPAAGWNCTDDVGVAIAGGFVYRGAALPALQGKYVFGDLVDGRLYYTEASQMVRGGAPATVHRLHVFTAAGDAVRMRDLSAPGAPGDPARVDLRFGADAAGELYVLAKSNGRIWKVTGTRTFAAASAGATTVPGTMSPASWTPLTPSRWQLTGSEVVLAQPGTARPGPRRPHEYALLTAGPRFGAVDVTASVRIDTPVAVTNRDVIIVFGHQSDTQYYYALLSTDNRTYPHNGIFKVNNADRERIDLQWNGRSRGANPSIPGTNWHQVRVKHLPATGEIAVYIDGAANPRMTAVDRTFRAGRVGFGSFDNIGRLRSFAVTGTPAP
jgi:glucose/arabinose dehydrogenase